MSFISPLVKLNNQNTIIPIIESLLRVTNEINQSLPQSSLDDPGADDIAKYLEKNFLPLVKDMSDDAVNQYLIKMHIAHLYLHAGINALSHKYDGSKKEGEQAQLIQYRECFAVVEAMRAMLIRIICKRHPAQNDAQLNEIELLDYDNILKPIEKEYDDFALLLSKSTQTNINKICSIDIGKVADMSRCITMTELMPINNLRAAVRGFYPDKNKRNQFQHTLFNYVTDNFECIVNTQIALNSQEMKMNPRDQTLLQILMCIEDIILQTTWNVGWLGGVPIYSMSDKLLNRVPHGMSNILDLIIEVRKDFTNESVNQSTQIMDAFKNILNQTILSAKNKSPSLLAFFGVGQRDEQTQKHYDDFSQSFDKTLCFVQQKSNF